MKIKEVTSQNRRDFTAILICEGCGKTQSLSGGYDDYYYHSVVIPKIKCKSCGEAGNKDYVPRETKYPDGFDV